MGDRRHRGSATEDDNHSLDTTYIDWEEALGISEDAFEDDIKGIDESKLSSRLHKVRWIVVFLCFFFWIVLVWYFFCCYFFVVLYFMLYLDGMEEVADSSLQQEEGRTMN